MYWTAAVSVATYQKTRPNSFAICNGRYLWNAVIQSCNNRYNSVTHIITAWLTTLLWNRKVSRDATTSVLVMSITCPICFHESDISKQDSYSIVSYHRTYAIFTIKAVQNPSRHMEHWNTNNIQRREQWQYGLWRTAYAAHAAHNINLLEILVGGGCRLCWVVDHSHCKLGVQISKAHIYFSDLLQKTAKQQHVETTNNNLTPHIHNNITSPSNNTLCTRCNRGKGKWGLKYITTYGNRCCIIT